MIGCCIFLFAWLFICLSKPFFDAGTPALLDPTGYSAGEGFGSGIFLPSISHSSNGATAVTGFVSAGGR
jgi:hypothetical protein